MADLTHFSLRDVLFLEVFTEVFRSTGIRIFLLYLGKLIKRKDIIVLEKRATARFQWMRRGTLM